MPRPAGPNHWKKFRACPDCGHSNKLFGCECENEACICFKSRTGEWNGVWQVNGGDTAWGPRVP